MSTLRRFWKWASGKPALRWTAENLDALLAAVLAAVFMVLSALDALEEAALFQAVAGLLIVMAIALFRERSLREQAVTRIERIVAGLRAATAWEVLESRFEWELLSDDGKSATATNRKALGILSPTYSVHEFYDPDGELGRTTYRGSLNDGPIQTLPEMHSEFPGPGGRRYRLISLENMVSPGDRFRLESTRELVDSFTKSREYVRVAIETPARDVSMAVVWPGSRPPQSLRIERTGMPADDIGLDAVQILEDGRHRFERAFPGVRVGEEIVLVWTW